MSSTAGLSQLTVEIRQFEPQDYLGVRFHLRLADIGETVPNAYKSLYQELATQGIEPAGAPFLTASQPADGFIDLEVGAPCKAAAAPAGDLAPGRLPGGRAAVYLYKGPYDRVAAAYGELGSWIGAHGYTPAGPPREVYLTDPSTTPNPQDWLTEIVWPIAG